MIDESVKKKMEAYLPPNMQGDPIFCANDLINHYNYLRKNVDQIWTLFEQQPHKDEIQQILTSISDDLARVYYALYDMQGLLLF